jgi:hypothetical protein
MRSRRQHERQIDKLLAVIAEQNDRIMLLAGTPWQPPPAAEPAYAPPAEEPADYMLRPESYLES